MFHSTWPCGALSTFLPTCDLAGLSQALKLLMMMWTLSLFEKIPRENILGLNMRFDCVLPVSIPFDFSQDCGWCRSIHQTDNLGSLRTGCALCIPLCSVSRPKTCNCCSQSQHHVCQSGNVSSIDLTIDRKMSDGMFLSACREVSKEFPDIAYDEDLMDRVCLRVCYRSLPNEQLQWRVWVFRLQLTLGHIPTALWWCPIYMAIFCQTCVRVLSVAWV